MAESLTLHPGASIPKATGNWGDAKAAYRLLNEPDVTPDALQQPHRRVVVGQCAELPMVLCLQDASDLDYTFRNGTERMGKIGDGKGRGLIQHTALAVEPEQGRSIGLLHQSCLIVRVMHYDRKLADGHSLEQHLRSRPVLDSFSVTLHEQRDERNRVKHAGRTARLDTPARLAQIVPTAWIAVVATLARIDPAKLTVSQFYRRVAMRGGWLGRKSDGPPGWKTLWRGWSELWWLVQGYELALASNKRSGYG